MSVWVDFIEAQLTEDERVGRAATEGGSWKAKRLDGDELFDGPFTAIYTVGFPWRETARCVGTSEVARSVVSSEGEHIARHDPARVLADVAAKRRILARHKPGDPKLFGWAPNWCEGCGYEGEAGDPRTEDIDDCPEIRDLASTWADHEDYPGRAVTT
jgi:hypothetical protein